MKIAVPKETWEGERRVGLVPESVSPLLKIGLSVTVETGAGASAGFSDDDFAQAGAEITSGDVLAAGDVVFKVRAPSPAEVERLRPGTVLLALMDPAVNESLIAGLAGRKVSVLSLERIPRITRAQSMDVLSSQATVAGYMAVLMAAQRLPRFFPMLMTAAGTIKAAQVLIIGAGVAGLQAIGTAKRLGARVKASDVRPAAREEVESLGARFVGAELLDEAAKAEGGYAKEQTEEQKARQKEVLRDSISKTDVIICSALVAGGRAPVVLDAPSVEVMKQGSVIIDLAAEQGGNCALTQPGQEVIHQGVTICGLLNVTSMKAADASRMFSRNLTNLMKHLAPKGEMANLAEDEIARACLVAHDGQVWSGGSPATEAGAAGGKS
ncbi:MAG: Re/Si-specific NAD(P)(+) transhydrogenase subunit alpha [Acidobacteria bacterium]|nr:MAG: Re/Si-specific NAD(P)(+) transhydrogenase subunit alpha [Acidobacteriota bacterium]